MNWQDDELGPREHEVVEVYDGDEMRVYIDDVLWLTGPNPFPAAPFVEFDPDADHPA